MFSPDPDLMEKQTAETVDLNEFHQMMEEELETIYPSHSDEPDGEPLSEHDQGKVKQFAEEFETELESADKRKMMFIMDIAIHVGETPEQLRRTIENEENGIEVAYQIRMAIHLAAKDLGVSYQEAAKIVGDMVFGTKKGTRLH